MNTLSGPCLEAPWGKEKCSVPFVPFCLFLTPSPVACESREGVWGQRGALLATGQSLKRVLVPEPKGCSVCPMRCSCYKGQPVGSPDAPSKLLLCIMTLSLG